MHVPTPGPLGRSLAALRSGCFVGLMATSTAIWGPLSLLTFPLAFPARYRFVSQWARFNVWTLRWICGVRYRIEGLENLPEGPCVVLAKHQSTWETLVLQRLFVPQVWVLKQELLRVPFFGWALRMLEPIAIDRSSARVALKQVLKQGAERLAAGYKVVVYPEGTRIAPGEHARFNIGGAMLAAQTGVPVVPVAHNAGECWPRSGLIKHPGTITLSIGPPICEPSLSAQQINEAAEAWIRSRQGELDGRARQLS